MLSSVIIFNQIKTITCKLIKIGLSADQNFPSNDKGQITYFGMQDISIAMKNITYEEIYKQLEETRNFNIKMLDGALIQMLYSFKGTELVAHRLAFFPAPNLESFQNEPKIYEDDEIYADILGKNIVTFPIRFDFDPNNFEEIKHPKTHITLGQYKNCRIPISEPLTPELFIAFVLRNFYNTAFETNINHFVISTHRFSQTITDKEKSLLHLGIY